MWVTYIIYSPSLDRYYIGYTHDIDTRLRQHRSGLTQTTSRADDWIVVFKQSHPDEGGAIRLERLMKSQKSRRSIERFIRDGRNEVLARP